jgi:hypothetical protein
MRKYVPLYIAMLLALVAAIWWLETEESTDDVVVMPELPPVTPKREYWSFLPPVAYVIRK